MCPLGSAMLISLVSPWSTDKNIHSLHGFSFRLAMLDIVAGQWAPRRKAAYLATTSSSGETFESTDGAPLLLCSAPPLVHRQPYGSYSWFCRERAKGA